ncbi:MAG: response regulator [Thermoanaerobaculales bacterium]|jgi:two-component system chemotaxis response regulator CheY|nr:response regulator [Thermoanaerobaculales bacterium]
MKALVIDDSRAMRSILSGILASLDFEVEEAADGRQALEMLGRETAFDIALVDWNLPGMSGLEIVIEVRKDPALADTRLLMVTTETEFQRVAQALQAGADEYIMKPFDRDMLLDKLVILGVPVEPAKA